MDYQEIQSTVEVPKGTGIEGFLKAVRELLKIPRLQQITIDARGKISYVHHAREGERLATAIDFDALMPYALIRNGDVVEVVPTSPHPATVIGELFDAAASDHMYPVAWVGGANSMFWRWYENSTGLVVHHRDQIFGLPFLKDRMVDDATLLLCTAFSRQAGIADTQKTYKMLLLPVRP